MNRSRFILDGTFQKIMLEIEYSTVEMGTAVNFYELALGANPA